MSNKKEKEDKVFWLLWLFAVLLLIITISAYIFWKDYLDEVVPAEEIAQLSPEIKNKIKQEVKGCEMRGHSVTWINEATSEPFTRREINNLKKCLQHEAEGKDKIASDMNAYYEQKKAIENQINAAK